VSSVSAKVTFSRAPILTAGKAGSIEQCSRIYDPYCGLLAGRVRIESLGTSSCAQFFSDSKIHQACLAEFER